MLVTNGSLQADAFLFDHLVHAGDEVIIESPTYDRTLLGLRQRGAQLHAIELQQDGIDTDALGHLLSQGASRRSPTSSPTSRTRPATRSRCSAARRCWPWPRRTTS